MTWLSSSIKEVIVYKSTAQNIWANLALEDWIFKNVDLSWRRILLLWRNSPCVRAMRRVVIGRHQNPWLETNIPLLRERNISLARRRSGGGTVYHDLGNLNCTVFTHRLDYNRPRNLQLVCDTLNEGWGTRLHVNKKDDIICNDQWKVSGSSAKLAKNPAYHHFTLLLDVDMDNLHGVLEPHRQFHISQTSATNSIRSQVVNLRSLVPELNYNNACAAIGDKFYDVHNITDGRKVVNVDPTCEEMFPGITAMRNDLEEWEWVYGKTPKFTLSASEELCHAGNISFTADIAHGCISTCSFRVSNNSNTTLPTTLTDMIANKTKGLRFWYSDVKKALRFNDCDSSSPNFKEISNWIMTLL